MIMGELNRIKIDLESILQEFKLKIPRDNIEKYELGCPKVHIAAIPPQSSEANDYTIPAVVIEVAGKVTIGEDFLTLPVMLTEIVYSGTFNTVTDTVPSFNGYLDLINLMDFLLLRVVNIYAGRINNVTVSIDEEQYNDFWIGRVSFNLCCQGVPNKAAYKNI